MVSTENNSSQLFTRHSKPLPRLVQRTYLNQFPNKFNILFHFSHPTVVPVFFCVSAKVLCANFLYVCFWGAICWCVTAARNHSFYDGNDGSVVRVWNVATSWSRQVSANDCGRRLTHGDGRGDVARCRTQLF